MLVVLTKNLRCQRGDACPYSHAANIEEMVCLIFKRTFSIALRPHDHDRAVHVIEMKSSIVTKLDGFSKCSNRGIW